MSEDVRQVVSRMPYGRGVALDLGGAGGALRTAFRERGYEYVNLDLAPSGPGTKVRGDAHRMPFAGDAFDLVVCHEAMAGVADPQRIVCEVRRVLRPGGTFVFWAPFLHPMSGNDYYRFTSRGLRLLVDRAGLRVSSLETTTWVFAFVAQLLVVVVRRAGLGVLERPLERVGALLDRVGLRLARTKGEGLAMGFVVRAHKGSAGPAERSEGVDGPAAGGSSPRTRTGR